MTRFFAAILVALCAVASAFGSSTATNPDRLSCEVQIRPTSGAAGQHTTIFFLREVETDRVVLAGKIDTLEGREGVTTSDIDPSRSCRTTVFVEGNRASYSVSVKRNGETVYSSTGSIELQR